MRKSYIVVNDPFGGEIREDKTPLKRDLEETIVCSELLRHYYVHLPPGHDQAPSMPLLIALHGRLGTGKRMSKQSGFNEIADRERFMVVYPDGIKRSWADGRGVTRADEQNVHDVMFLDKLIQYLRGRFSVDNSRIYLIGHSNGGFMALRFCIERPRRIAAVAVVAASLTDDLAKGLHPGKVLSVFFIHGTADSVTPYDGCRLPGGGKTLPVEDAAKFWAHVSGCNEAPEVQEIHGLDGSPVASEFTYMSCQNHGQVKLYRIKGGGHAWPGEPEGLTRFGEGKGRHEIDASEEIWKFFKRVT
jgi:polyhydroxybutyrate depolymerase